MRRRLCALWTAALWLAGPNLARAGGSGLNVVVVVNEASAQSVELGNYYCERRMVPPEQLFRIHWTSSAVEWTRSEFESVLLRPLATWVQARQLTNQIEYLVLSMDIPYRVVENNGTNGLVRNSTTSVLFYGWQPDTNAPGNLPRSCSLPPAVLHAYAGSEMPFRAVASGSAWSNWLVTMITASNLAQAKAVVDRGVAADESWPTQSVYLLKSTDSARNVRHWWFDDAIFEQRVLGRVSMVPTNANSPAGLGLQLGCQSGFYGFSLPANLFVPGAMADNLTSFGGWLFEDAAGMTRVPDFLAAGATASYGTVVEPCNWTEKFPGPRNYFYQARGFNIAECYYQSIAAPYQGVVVGEPLAAPFARRPRGDWIAPAPEATVSGPVLLEWHFQAADPARPIGRVDLFVDGRFHGTPWESRPAVGNRIRLQLAGHEVAFEVTEELGLGEVAQRLADVLNRPEQTNATGVVAEAIGDRLLLRSTVPGRPGAATPAHVETLSGTNAVLNLYARLAQPAFVDSTALGFRGFTLRRAPGPADWLQLIVTKSNGVPISIAVTNEAGTNTAGLAHQLVAAVNAHPQLLGPDGLSAGDLSADGNGTNVSFVVRARTPGWTAAALLQAELTASEALTVEPTGPQTLEENLEDLQPRNHLYLACGARELPLQYELDTTTLADGWHECVAVAYEGTHVATQGHVTRRFRVANTTRQAALRPLLGGSLTRVSLTLRWQVSAEPTGTLRVELFTTGGSWDVVTNAPPVEFEVPGPRLGPGLHPFYAVVTWPDGSRYRTETHWVRLVPDDASAAPLWVEVQGPPWQLRWPVVVGRTYAVWSTTELDQPFQLRAAWTVTNAPGTWVEPDPTAPARYYRVSELP
ncbi:MAG: TIGR03790 family protein [Limisphaera sp.]